MISSGRVSVRLLPQGSIFGHKGSAIFAEDPATSERFLLGYLNSSLATYFMKKLINTTATADVGYVEKLPYRRPTPDIEAAVVTRVDAIIAALQQDAEADVSTLRREIDDLVFDLYEIRSARDEVRRFYETVGRVTATAASEDQAAIE